MKKKLLIILMFLLLTANLFAGKAYLKSESQGLPIYAYLRTFCELYINEYAADSTDTIGMPFSITNSNVKYNSSDIKTGRLIGSWSFSTNSTSLTIKIEPEALKHPFGNQLDYYLTFYYEYFKADKSRVGGYIVTSSKSQKSLNVTTVGQTSAATFNSDASTNPITLTNTTSIISTEKDIRIMYDDNYNVEDDNLFPYGQYNATVKITIDGGV